MRGVACIQVNASRRTGLVAVERFKPHDKRLITRLNTRLTGGPPNSAAAAHCLSRLQLLYSCLYMRSLCHEMLEKACSACTVDSSNTPNEQKATRSQLLGQLARRCQTTESASRHIGVQFYERYVRSPWGGSSDVFQALPHACQDRVPGVVLYILNGASKRHTLDIWLLLGRYLSDGSVRGRGE